MAFIESCKTVRFVVLWIFAFMQTPTFGFDRIYISSQFPFVIIQIMATEWPTYFRVYLVKLSKKHWTNLHPTRFKSHSGYC